MKLFFLIFSSIIICSCSKESNCDYTNSACNESPPDGTTCQAYFESWLYDKDSKSCKWTGYSGCGKIGFETKEECEKCECNK